MIIKHLALKNFMQYESLDIDIPESIVLIVGANGAGKSTLLDGITVALFGPDAARDGKQSLRSDFAGEASITTAEVSFLFEGAEYVISRSWKGKAMASQATATLRSEQGEMILATGVDAVDKFVEGKILPKDMFLFSFLAHQNELANLSTAKPSEKLEFFISSLGIDNVDRVLEAIRRDEKSARDRLEGYSGLLDDIQQLNEELVLAEKKINSLREKEHDLSLLISNATEDLSFSVSLLEAMEEKKALFIENKNEIARARAQRDAISLKIADLTSKAEAFSKDMSSRDIILKQVESLRSALPSDQEIEKMIEERRAYAIAYADYTTKNDAHNKTVGLLENIKNKVFALTALVDKRWEQLLLSLQNDLSDLLSKEKDLSSHIEISDLPIGSKCPTCGQKITEKVDVEEKKLELALVLKKIEETKEEMQVVSKKVDEQKKIEKELDDLVGQERALRSVLTDPPVEPEKPIYNQEESERIIAQRNTLSALERELSILNEGKIRLEETQLQLAVLLEELKSIVIPDEMQFDYDSYEKTEKLVAEKKEEISLATETISKIHDELIVIETEKTIKTAQLASLGEKTKERESLLSTVSSLRKLLPIFQSLKIDRVGRIRPAMSNIMSNLYYRFTEGAYGQLVLDEKYEMLISSGGELRNLRRFSGSEKELASLCLRLAITNMITAQRGGRYQFLALDEIFQAHTSERKMDVMNVIQNISKTFPQILIISHDDFLKSCIPTIIEVTKKENGRSVAALLD